MLRCIILCEVVLIIGATVGVREGYLRTELAEFQASAESHYLTLPRSTDGMDLVIGDADRALERYNQLQFKTAATTEIALDARRIRIVAGDIKDRLAYEEAVSKGDGEQVCTVLKNALSRAASGQSMHNMTNLKLNLEVLFRSGVQQLPKSLELPNALARAKPAN